MLWFLKNCSNMWSNGVPLGRSGTPSAVLSSIVWVAEMLTTASATLSTRSARLVGRDCATAGTSGGATSARAMAEASHRRRKRRVVTGSGRIVFILFFLPVQIQLEKMHILAANHVRSATTRRLKH